MSIGHAKNFQGCLPQSSLKKLGQILTPLAILDHFERFSPGPNGSEVGCPARLFKVIWRPTSEPFGPGENLSNRPQIARAVRIWPKFFSDDWGRQPWKCSLALMEHCLAIELCKIEKISVLHEICMFKDLLLVMNIAEFKFLSWVYRVCSVSCQVGYKSTMSSIAPKGITLT